MNRQPERTPIRVAPDLFLVVGGRLRKLARSNRRPQESPGDRRRRRVLAVALARNGRRPVALDVLAGRVRPEAYPNLWSVTSETWNMFHRLDTRAMQIRELAK